VLIDGENEGFHSDPVGDPPTGGGISIVSSAANNSEQRVQGLEVFHWDADGDRHRTEERGNAEQDALISRDGDRMEGGLLEIRAAADGPELVFRSDFLEEPAVLPEEDVSTVFFAGGGSAPAGAHPFQLQLHGGGVLRVASCVFSGDRIEANHPLLGRIPLARDGVTALERSVNPRPADPIK
jgi:hypothetical protein